MNHPNFSGVLVEAFGLTALAGAASNNVKQRESLQQYKVSGDADEVLDYLGETANTFMDSIDQLAKVIASEYRQKTS